MNKKNIIIGIGIIIAFIFLIASILMYIGAQQKIRQSERIDITHINDYNIEQLQNYITTRSKTSTTPINIYLIPFMAFIGLIVGILVYYIMSDKITQKNKSLKVNSDILLNLLSTPERKIIKKIISEGGKVRQYELTYLDGLNKLKVHRILQTLEDNDIIKKEKLGKVNNIILNKEIYEILKEKKN